MNDKENILIISGKEYFYSAEDDLEKQRHNSAVVLFFKALISFSDLYILQKTGETPSSHNERFKISKERFPEVYDLLDKDFPFYQSSYIQIMNKELAEVIKDDVKTMAEKTQVKL